MLLPWNTTVFQVRAEFSRRGIGFKSDMLRVNGTLAGELAETSYVTGCELCFSQCHPVPSLSTSRIA